MVKETILVELAKFISFLISSRNIIASFISWYTKK